MSWSVGAKGPVADVKIAIAGQFQSGSKCQEPEETIRQKATELVALALDAQGYMPSVDVSAFGSMSKDYSTGAVANSLSIIITPHS